MGGNRDYFSGINGNWNIVRFSMGMGRNGYTKVIPANF